MTLNAEITMDAAITQLDRDRLPDVLLARSVRGKVRAYQELPYHLRMLHDELKASLAARIGWTA